MTHDKFFGLALVLCRSTCPGLDLEGRDAHTPPRKVGQAVAARFRVEESPGSKG